MRKKRILFTAMLCISVMTIIPGCGKKSDDDITNEEVYGEMEPLTDEELEENSRSKSSKLRVFERA